MYTQALLPRRQMETRNDFTRLLKEDGILSSIINEKEKLKAELEKTYTVVEETAKSWKIGTITQQDISLLVLSLKDTSSDNTFSKVFLFIQNIQKHIMFIMSKTTLTIDSILHYIVDNVKGIIPESVRKYASDVYNKHIKEFLQKFKEPLTKRYVRIGGVAINLWLLVKNLLMCACIGLVLHLIYRLIFKKDPTGAEPSEAAMEDIRLTQGFILHTIGRDLTWLLAYVNNPNKFINNRHVAIQEALRDSQISIKRFDDYRDVGPITKYFKSVSDDIVRESSKFIGKFIALIIVLPLICAILVLLHMGLEKLKQSDTIASDNKFVQTLSTAFNSIFRILKIEPFTKQKDA